MEPYIHLFKRVILAWALAVVFFFVASLLRSILAVEGDTGIYLTFWGYMALAVGFAVYAFRNRVYRVTAILVVLAGFSGLTRMLT
jgi:hypothetical protein